MIPYGKQDILEEDIDSIVKVLRSEFLTQGPVVPDFEQALCHQTGAEYAIAVNSATSALHIACLSLGLGSGDILWTSPITFVASANCAFYCGATVDFVDVELDTALMDIDKLEEKLIQAEIDGKLPKIVIPVHFAGQPCDMERIYHLGQKYDFYIIEDASHALGAKYQNEPVGNCRFSNISVFSFHPVKIITTGEGGASMTNDKILAKKMQLLRSHGVTRDFDSMTKMSEGAWYYEQTDLGFNYRMTEIHAALGISQLKRLEKFIAKRHKLKERYDKSIKALPVIKPYQKKDSYSAMHLYPIQFNLEKLHFNREKIFNELRNKGIGVNVHYIPVHTQPYYLKMGFKHGDFPNSEKFYSRVISLPIFPKLSFEDQKKIISTLKEIIK
jgi:UDP-4-amino-4,6-dideoxy-N-acetyl-beta-L-altrosamine transaminase